MTKTVKELVKEYDIQYHGINKPTIIIDDLMKDILQAHKNELAEKDRKIDLLLTANREITYSIKSREYNQQQLYKEDFVIYSFGYDKCNLTYSCKNKCKLFWALKDNSKYYKLPSKELINND